MLLVIYSHLCYKLFGIYPESVLNNIFVTFRMPLFFFVSGFFMFSDKMDYTLYRKRLLNRFFIQLYPTLLLLGAFCTLTGADYAEALTTPFKEGYWFTFVSVEMYVIIGMVILLICRLQLSKQAKARILLLIACLSAVTCVIFRKTGLSETPLYQILSVDPFSHFTPYLCMGCIFRIYYVDFINRFLKLKYLISFTVILLLTNLFPKYSLFTLLPAISGIYLLHYVCYHLYNLSNKSQIIKQTNKTLGYIGTLTLEIYLLHYIILHIARTLFPSLVSIGQQMANTALEFPVYIAVSLIVAAICIICVRLFNWCGINQLLFPKKETLNNLTTKITQNRWNRTA